MSFSQQARTSHVSLSQIIQFPTKRKSMEACPQELNSFADNHYLNCVIRFLAQARADKHLNHHEVAKRATIRRSVIIRAERDGVIPRTAEFKAWASALGYTWENLWTLNLPKSEMIECHSINEVRSLASVKNFQVSKKVR